MKRLLLHSEIRLHGTAGVAVLLAWSLSSIWAQIRVPRIGDEAPPLKLGVIVQGQISKTPGRAMVLEFWAASCPPCVAVLPHVNELAKDFKSSDIDFVFIDAYEDADTVRHFLQAHPMDGVVALDTSPGMVDAYGVQASPVTILISRGGRVVAVAHPSQITAAVLRSLLLGEPIYLPSAPDAQTVVLPKRRSYLLGATSSEERSLVHVVIIPTANEGMLSSSADQVESTGTDLKSILSYAYDIPPFRIFMASALSEERYEFRAWVPTDSPATLKPLIQSAIISAAAIVIKKQQRKMDGFVLQGLPGKLIPVHESVHEAKLSAHCQGSHMTGDPMTTEALRQCVEQMTGKSVVLPVEVAGLYRWDVKWDSPSAFETALKEELGITLIPVKQLFDVLTVEAARH